MERKRLQVICGIYAIHNKVNNKIYIGQSINIRKRWYGHRYELRHGRHKNKHLQSAWNKYGEDSFEFLVIEQCLKKDLNDKERYYISYYNSYDKQYGYNQTLGGDAGIWKVQKILQFDTIGNFIRQYNSVMEASIAVGISDACIYQCMNKKMHHAGGFVWIRKNDYQDRSSLNWWLNFNNRYRTVYQFDFKGNLVRVWDSCSQIEENLGFSPEHCVRHISKSEKGYIWRYGNDIDEITPKYCKEVGKHASKYKKAIVKCDDKGNVIEEFTCAKDANKHGYHLTMIRECLRGEREKYKGFIWKYKEEIENGNENGDQNESLVIDEAKEKDNDCCPVQG